MKAYLLVATLFLLMSTPAAANSQQLLDIELRTLAGKQLVNLSETYKNKVVLVVNVASKCGYTYQYEKLEAVYQKYKDQGLVVLGFPSNDFLGQEPGSEQQIEEFCRSTYGVKFPMFEKITVKQQSAHLLYQRLAKQAGSYPKWNFHKYLIAKDGTLVGHYGSAVEPDGQSLLGAIEAELAK